MSNSRVKPKNVDEYISNFPSEIQNKLMEIRECIRSVAPDATESIKWGMPAFSYKRILVAYAAFKHHIGLYPTPPALLAFANESKRYITGKGSIQFPLDKPLPLLLIKRIVKFRVEESRKEDVKWRS